MRRRGKDHVPGSMRTGQLVQVVSASGDRRGYLPDNRLATVERS